MSKRTLMIALAASLAINVFAVAAGVAAYVNHTAAEDRIERSRGDRAPRVPLMEVIDTLDPPVRDQVRDTLRRAALAARPDFQEARDTRRRAMGMANGEAFDAAEVSALLEQSRASELRGRARLESEAVRMLSELEPEDRVLMSSILARHGPGHRNRTNDRRERRDVPVQAASD
ncbi:MAG: periplasmic heavy metal sensor [Brevundimonas sp.]|uniref:periplasmic heavy metal sensor n=1 Tax=Brevundimonas sp. TaxID=1871086 RepID=UPI00391DCA95